MWGLCPRGSAGGGSAPSQPNSADRHRGCSAAILSLGSVPGGSGAMLRWARFLFAVLPASAASYPPHPWVQRVCAASQGVSCVR